MGRILCVNGGASSLKFALFEARQKLARVFDGKIDRIGSSQAKLVTRRAEGRPQTQEVDAADRRGAVEVLLGQLDSEHARSEFEAVGQRIVHGGIRYCDPCVITPDVRAGLEALAPLDPEHLPFELDLIDGIARRWPALPQIAAFDTAFHRGLPRVAQLLALPRRYFDAGVRRFGFHGLSCTYLHEELQRTAEAGLCNGRLLFAHLGGGSSLTAVVAGRSVDTTMSFTPASGVPMGTRCGDIDPGIVGYLARTEGMESERFMELVHQESGLLGISGTSSDIRDLLERAPSDPHAAEAIDLYCYEITKRIGALAAAMGGLDGLVFSGGIGENAAPIRARICERLGFLGIRIDASKNEACAAVISEPTAPVSVRVIKTDEERVIAQAVVRVLEAGQSIRGAPRGMRS